MTILELPWIGHHIVVNQDESITWIRCARCNRALSDPESMGRGYGPDCMVAAEPGELEACKEKALEVERVKWRQEERYQAVLTWQRRARDLRRRHFGDS